MRPSGRAPDQLRPVRITRGYTRHAEGSVLVEFGDTRVLCTASIDEKVPPFLKGKGQGWLTAEYGMLPRSTGTRTQREAAAGKQSGRTQEIQRLIGRSLRAVTNLVAARRAHHPDRLRRDPGRRRHAHRQHHRRLRRAARCGAAAAGPPAHPRMAASATSSPRCRSASTQGVPVLDLDYDEDSTCETDMNVVMTGSGGIVEVQGTAEGEPFSRAELDAMVDLAGAGISQLVAAQRAALGV